MSRSSPTADSPWSALCLRLTVLTLPAQVLGAVVGAVPTYALGAGTVAAPWVAALVPVAMGTAAGVAVGRLSAPPARRFPAAAAVAAGFGLASFAVLRLIAQLRVTGAPTSPLSWLLGG